MGLKSLCTAFALLLSAHVCGAESDSMRTIVKAGFSGIQEASQMVVTNQAGWEALWQRHNLKSEPKVPPPAVDFSKETVLAVAQGEKRSGGYSTEILGLKQSGSKTVISFRNKSPKPGALTIQALTAPIHIVAVPRITGEFEFKAVE